jgi:hypothetical protein
MVSTEPGAAHCHKRHRAAFAHYNAKDFFRAFVVNLDHLGASAAKWCVKQPRPDARFEQFSASRFKLSRDQKINWGIHSPFVRDASRLILGLPCVQGASRACI